MDGAGGQVAHRVRAAARRGQLELCRQAHRYAMLLISLLRLQMMVASVCAVR